MNLLSVLFLVRKGPLGWFAGTTPEKSPFKKRFAIAGRGPLARTSFSLVFSSISLRVVEPVVLENGVSFFCDRETH